MRLMLALMLVLTTARQTTTTLTFPPHKAICTGGGANDAHLHPGVIVCERHTTGWECASTPLHDAFLNIHDAVIHCNNSAQCSLSYQLDFTPLAVFCIGFCATVLAGVFLALAMYLAVSRMAGRYADIAQRKHVLARRPGYGSFGGKLYHMGHLSESLKNLLDYDVEDGDSQSANRRDEGGLDDRLNWVTERIYIG